MMGEKRLKELGLSSLVKRRLRGWYESTTTWRLKKTTTVTAITTKVNVQKLLLRRFRLNMRKNLSTGRLVQQVRVAQRSYRTSVPGGFQDFARWRHSFPYLIWAVASLWVEIGSNDHHFCDLVKIWGRHHYRLSFVEGSKYEDISKNERLHQLDFAFYFIVILTLWEILFKVFSATSAVNILHRSFLANLLSVCLCVKDIEASVYRLQKAHKWHLC